ncbi:MAG: hypothetical protein HKN35_06710 [Woeseia sp.]|nr:hypothetical protein [Woeseia sp.]MBT8103507.1 hypothetical protein [Gammaproteobacteria bacterium]NNE60564.1 hypothetical protein [Woeseia sp.]NNL53996.1 hypothetical protein [Woeseia sp.]
MFMRIIACFLLLSLAACGGGGGGGFSSTTPAPAPPPPVVNELPGGLWFGSMSFNETGTTSNAEVISIDSGEFRIVTDDGGHFVGRIQMTGTSFSGTGTGFSPVGSSWANGSTFADLRVDGSIDERQTFDGNWVLTTGESGTFSFDFDSLFERTSAPDRVADTWTLRDDFDTAIGSVLIDDAGRLDGQDDNGCMYTGNVSTIDPLFNVYDMRLTIISCNESSGTYTGLGFLVDVLDVEDEFAFLIDKGTLADIGYFSR